MRIRSGSVELHAFEPALSEAVHAVRNHPSVRKHLRDPRPIAWESHARWVQANLVEARTQQLFVVQRSGKSLGITLLRDFRAAEAEIGVMIIEPARHRLVAYTAGYLTAYVAFEILGLDRLVSKVPLAHREALEFNLRCGFERTGESSADYHVLAMFREQYVKNVTRQRLRQRRDIVHE